MQQTEAAPNISLSEIAVLAYTERKKLLYAIITPVLLAIILVIILPSVWRAETDILVKTGREYLPQSSGEGAMGAPASTKQEDINSEIELLTNRPMIEEAITTIGLKNIYPDEPSLFGSLFGWMGELFGPSTPNPGKIMDAAVKRFSGDLNVEPVKLTNIINVTFDAEDKERSARILDQFVSLYQENHAKVYAGLQSKSYEGSIASSLADIDKLEARRTEIKLDNHIYDIAQQRGALITQRVETQTRLEETRNNKATLEQRVGYLSSVRPKIPDSLPPAEEMSHLRTALTDLKMSETSMSARYGSGNPDLRNVREQIKATEEQIATLQRQAGPSTSLSPSPLAQQIDQELVMDRAELAPLDDTIKRSIALIASIDSELQRLETADQELRSIGMRVDALNDNLKTLQGHYDQLRTEDEMDRSKVISVVQMAKAVVPDKPAAPKKSLFVGGGLLLGLLIAGGMVVFKVMTNNTVINEQGAERLLGLPVLVSVPLLAHHKTQSR